MIALDPKHRFATIVLAIGAAVLLSAIALGERMGNRVLGQATQHSLQSVVPEASAQPNASSGPYGPDWKRSEILAAAPDPHFPDPRVPPQPLPTPPPPPSAAPLPLVPATPTPNPNIPIWRQRPLPTATPTLGPSAAPSTSPAASAGEQSAPPGAQEQPTAPP